MNILVSSSCTKQIWRKKESDSILLKQATTLYNIDSKIASILLNRGISLENIPDFLDSKIKNHINDPNLLHDMDKLCKRIYKAVVKKEQIMILGDYDVDGITSTSILFDYLKNLNFSNIKTYIPDRYKEGYGISFKVLYEIEKKPPKLLILLDNGSVSTSEIDYANKLGIDVIIIDHHSVDVTYPAAFAFINPKKLEDNSKNENLCTVGLVFLSVIALNRYFEEKNYFLDNQLTKVNALKYLDLVALGTVCDMVPIVDLNRAFIIQGVKMIRKRHNISLSTLVDKLGVSHPVDVETLGFLIGPCINAGSRMGDSKVALSLLLEEDASITSILADRIVELNERRKEEEEKTIQSALSQTTINGFENSRLIFLGSSLWSSGIVGIIASRIKENYNKPSLIYSINEKEQTATGSGRSIEGLNLGNIIIAAKQKGLLIKGGGHSQAVGFTFSLSKKKELFEFLQEKIDFASRNISPYKVIMVDELLSLRAVNLDLAQEISKMQPFGNYFSEPLFMFLGVKISSAIQVGKNKNHLMLNITDGFKYNVKAFCYKCIPSPLGDSILNNQGNFINLVASIKLNFFRGKYNVQLIIKDISV